MRWLRDLALGGLIGGGTVHSLLDASPLRAHIAAHLPLDGIGKAIRTGHLYAVAVSATSYHSGKSYTFIQGKPGHPVWIKSRRVSLPVEITLDHVLASAAIPIVFPPVRVRSEVGECYFGDGGMRLVMPLSPAIRLGATRVFAVGIRCQSAADALTSCGSAKSRTAVLHRSADRRSHRSAACSSTPSSSITSTPTWTI